MNIGERCLGVVVVIHEAVIVLLPVRGDFFNHKARLLHRSAAVLEVAAHFIGGFFQGAIETESLRFRWADSVVCAIPFLRGVEYLLCELRNPHIVRGYGGLVSESLAELLWGVCAPSVADRTKAAREIRTHTLSFTRSPFLCNHSQTSCDYRRHVFGRHGTMARLEITSEGLLSFDGFKEGLEVAFAEAAAPLALDDLVEDRGAVFYGTGEDLKHVAFVVAVDEDT